MAPSLWQVKHLKFPWASALRKMGSAKRPSTTATTIIEFAHFLDKPAYLKAVMMILTFWGDPSIFLGLGLSLFSMSMFSSRHNVTLQPVLQPWRCHFLFLMPLIFAVNWSEMELVRPRFPFCHHCSVFSWLQWWFFLVVIWAWRKSWTRILVVQPWWHVRWEEFKDGFFLLFHATGLVQLRRRLSFLFSLIKIKHLSLLRFMLCQCLWAFKNLEILALWRMRHQKDGIF